MLEARRGGRVAEDGRWGGIVGEPFVEFVDKGLGDGFHALGVARQALIVGLAPVEKAQALEQFLGIRGDVLEQF